MTFEQYKNHVYLTLCGKVNANVEMNRAKTAITISMTAYGFDCMYATINEEELKISFDSLSEEEIKDIEAKITTQK